jgi:hypothetical protein
MDATSSQRTPSDQEEQHPTSPDADRQPWQEPKPAFVEPKPTAHGDLKQVTGQEPFFGGFTP